MLDQELTQRIERVMGKPIAQSQPVSGGYSPATREIVTFVDGTSAFIKAARDTETGTMAMWLRREHNVYTALQGAFMAKMLAFDDDAELPLLILEDLSAAHWPPIWREGDVQLVLDALAQIAPQAERVPDLRAPDGLSHILLAWHEIAKDPAHFLSLGLVSEAWLKAALPTLLNVDTVRAAEGDQLLHLDVRSDNLCLFPNRAVLFDWNWASRGNANLDIAAWLPSLTSEGGPQPETILPNAPEYATIMSGFFAFHAGRPPIPALPKLRAVQLAQLKAALPWAIRALGLPRDGVNLPM